MNFNFYTLEAAETTAQGGGMSIIVMIGYLVIIFGAMYDSENTDYARITVIATGLHDVEDKQQGGSSLGKVVPNFTYPNAGKYRPAPMGQKSAAASMPVQQGTQGAPRTAPGIQKPAKPRSTVQENDIQIPSFLTRKK